ncbi:MAG: efflux RND transporter periplasmic adaptor subunit [Opitutales bacterium]|nr:efflux RND transporter periplasmic adaptor subunit [Opitutales bacterium]
MKTIKKTFLLVACAALVLTFAACDKVKSLVSGDEAAAPLAAEAKQQVFPAHIYEVRFSERDLTQNLPGRVDAVRCADVRARVQGVLLERRFEEGKQVQKGQSLFLIDPAEILASKAAAEAQLAAASANLESAQLVFERFQKVIGKGGVSQQDYDNARIAVATAKAGVLQAQAALQTININLGYTEVVAPISGIVGAAQVTEGALVGPAMQSPLAVIQQMDPIYFDFTQSATDQLELRAAIKSGRVEQVDENSVPVELVLADGSVYPYKGKLKFSEVTIDRTTGMYKLRAEFENPEHILLPGMFARARICQGVDKEAILIPQEMLIVGSAGKAMAFVLGENNIVQVRQVLIGEMVGNKFSVKSGLKPGDRLVADGLIQIGMMLRSGPVTIIPLPPEGAAEENAVPAGAEK